MLSAKCIIVAALAGIIVAALAAVQSAYFLAQAGGVLARAMDAVALKARSGAVCDTWVLLGLLIASTGSSFQCLPCPFVSGGRRGPA